MIGMTALVSTLLGMIGGALPRAMSWLESASAHKRELEFLKVQHTLQMERMRADADARLREAESNIVAEEVRAMREHLTAIIETQARPTGSPFIDFFNAILRPTATAIILVMFCGFAMVLIQLYRTGHLEQAKALANAVAASQIGLAFEGLLGFLFGVRTTAKRWGS